LALNELIEGLGLVFQWPSIGFLLLGVLFGICLGVIPGLGVIIGLVVLLPFTFGMDPVPAFALLLGMYAVTSTSDTISSVMLGVPGTSASQATILDGYPLAQKGQGARALGAAFSTSAFGGVFGALILAISLPLIRPIIQSFSSPEIFMLGVLGLTMVSSVSGGSILKGLGAAALGLLMSTIGYSDSGAVPRYYFDIDYLIDGLPLIPVVLGLFAVPELMELAIRDASISRVNKGEVVAGGSIIDGVKDTYKHRWLALRCSLIGTYIGMLPGLGAAIVDWLAYGHAVQTAKDKTQFGQGDIRGVIAPEAANNATRGGSLVPTLAFGVPGSLGAAILLSALLIVGLKPGPEMLTTQLSTTFSMVWSIAIANILAAILLMMCAKQVAKVAFVPGHMIVPAVIMFVFMGAWLGGGHMGDWVACLVMSVVGFFMKRGGWPRPPLVLALVLGSIMENAYLLTIRVYDTSEWLQRPIVMVIAVIILITLLLVIRGIIKHKRLGEAPSQGEGAARNPVFSLPFAIVLFGVFICSALLASDWPRMVRMFPFLLACSGAVLVFFTLYHDTQALRSVMTQAGSLFVAMRDAGKQAVLKKACQFLCYLMVMMVVALLVGQKIALPLFVVVYLIRWGRYRWRTSTLYALFVWIFMVLFYDRVMHLFWYPSWLSRYLPEILPAWIPHWLFI
jgi:putative tricarboxylic transport membrane protein